MDNNINYIISDTISHTISHTISDTISDNNTNEPFDINLYNLEDEYDINDNSDTNYSNLYNLYINYNVKSLIQIMTYYDIYKKRLLKEEMILFLINFELDFSNKEIVLKRLRLWENIAELSQDNYFKNFITFAV